MPNNETSLKTPEKQPPRAAEGASKIVDGAHEIASAASNAVADKARQVREQVESATSSTQRKASTLAQEAAGAVKQTTGRVESAARGVVAGAKEVLNEVTHDASAALDHAQDIAADSYEAARDYTADVVDEASELARRASERTVAYARRTRTATGQFATLHALPLVAVGASLAWLAWSIRSNSQRRQQYLAPRTPRPARQEVRRPPVQEWRELGAWPVAPTTSGAKLMGVPVPDVRREFPQGRDPLS
jgi:ElaB/YqjD/DUF883 family membrane-anchored ribosome-binding protein